MNINPLAEVSLCCKYCCPLISNLLLAHPNLELFSATVYEYIFVSYSFNLNGVSLYVKVVLSVKIKINCLFAVVPDSNSTFIRCPHADQEFNNKTKNLNTAYLLVNTLVVPTVTSSLTP